MARRWSGKAFRLVMYAYPPSFRRRNGAQILAAIAAELDRATSDGSAAASWPLLHPVAVRLRLVLDLIRGAAGEWRRMLAGGTPVARGAAARLGVHTRIALRGLRRSSGFTLVSTLTIALGVAASTAVFSLVDGILQRPMPYDEPNELVFVWNRYGSWGVARGWVSGPQIAYLREHSGAFDAVAALDARDGELDTAGDSGPNGTLIALGEVSGNLFSLLGVEAARGRTLAADEEGRDAPRVAVLSDGIWRAAFDADPAVLGRSVRIDGAPHVVVGVMSPGFRFAIHAMSGAPQYPDVWVPMRRDLAAEPPGNNSFSVVARLADGVSPRQGSERLAAAAAEYAEDKVSYVGEDFGSFLVPLRGDLTDEVRTPLLLVGAAVSLLMLLVCANLTTLYLGRAIDGAQQTALCAALGAPGWARTEVRLIEALLVTSAGGIAGIVLSRGTVFGLVALAPAGLPRLQEVGINGRVVAFGLALSLAVGLAIALLPCLTDRRTDTRAPLRPAGSSVSRRSRTAQHALVVIQIALATSLVFSAALIGRSMMALTDIDPGFRDEGVLLASLRAPTHLIEDDREVVAALEQVRDRIVARNDVRQAGYAEFLPLSPGGDQNGFLFAGAPGSKGTVEHDEVVADHISIGVGYFEAIGIELVEGRAFSPLDRVDAERVVIIDQALARRFWPRGGAVGGTVRYYNEGRDARIVGVARHARRYDVRFDGRVQIYSPLTQRPVRYVELAIQPTAPSSELLAGLRALVDEVDPRVSLGEERTMEGHVDAALSSWHFMLQIMALFGGASLALASLGVHGVTAISVSNRTREICVRMAIGARRRDIAIAVMGEVARLVAAGVLIALVATSATGGLLQSFLYGVAGADPWSFALAAALLSAVALLAGWGPARRATRVAPADTLRGG